jgi:hypothetical protein
MVLLLCAAGLVRADEVRIQTLMVPDLIDDPVNISVFPHHVVQYANCLWGDIHRTAAEDFGFILSPGPRLGCLAVWQQSGDLIPGFNLGYGRRVLRFDLGLSGMFMSDHKHFGIGLGRSFFTKRVDLSFLYNDDIAEKWFRINQHALVRKGDYVLAYRYSYFQHREPLDYLNHKIAFMIQRLVLSEGFVHVAAEYNIQRGDLETDYLDLYAGAELPLSRTFVLRLGMMEELNSEWVPIWFEFQPGIGVRIRQFTLDFQFNKDRLQDKDEPLVNSFGVDLNFGGF